MTKISPSLVKITDTARFYERIFLLNILKAKVIIILKVILNKLFVTYKILLEKKLSEICCRSPVEIIQNSF